MPTKLNDDFIFQILAIVDEIPYGKVATYGQIARLAGYEKNARLVGRVLKISGQYGDYPCHRVVNGAGQCAVGFFEQRELLLQEGITFKKNGCVDLSKYQWKM